MSDFPKMIEIPPIFWSDLNHLPFDSCISCATNLLAGETPYLIEKAVQGFTGDSVSNTLFEYAMCVNCAQGMRGQLSKASLESVERFQQEHINFTSRLEYLKDKKESAWLEECLIHKRTVSENGECQLYALCIGNKLICQEFPYMIRIEALEELVSLISQETLDELDNFKNDLTSGPPELKELLEKGGPRVLF